MDKQLVAALAHAAGLEQAWRDFPEDVIAAAAQAMTHGAVIAVPTEPGAEPWPPMRPGTTL